jgi:tetratricopeptide (TPR) repeat protein
MGNLDQALASYERSVRVRPVSHAYLGLGTVQFFLGRRREAIATFERAVALTPRDERAWANLGDAQRWTAGEEGRAAASFDRAIALARESLVANPRDAEVWSHLAKWLAKRGQVAAALDAIRRALDLAPGNVSTVARAITVYELAGDRARARQFLEAALVAGYGRVELERDPELEELWRDPMAQGLKDKTFVVRGSDSAPS